MPITTDARRTIDLRGDSVTADILLRSVHDLAQSLATLTQHLSAHPGLLEPPSAPGPRTRREASELDKLRQEVTGLRDSMTTRLVIEQAKGVLMAERGCSCDEAFAILTARSQSEQRKVRELAVEIVASTQRPHPPRKQPS